MVGWPIAFIGELINLIMYSTYTNNNTSIPVSLIIRFVGAIFFFVAALGLEITLRRAMRHSHHHHHNHEAQQGYAVLENPAQQTPGYYDPNAMNFQKPPPAYNQQQEFVK